MEEQKDEGFVFREPVIVNRYSWTQEDPSQLAWGAGRDVRKGGTGGRAATNYDNIRTFVRILSRCAGDRFPSSLRTRKSWRRKSAKISAFSPHT